MSYREKSRHSYGNYPIERRNSDFHYKCRNTEKKEFLGVTFGKNTSVKEIECSDVPTVIEDGKENSVGGNVTNGVVGVGGSVINKDSNKTEFKSE